jgi:A/G-specific adenine glycosylase
MLQQTQSATVVPYFLRWMERFPDVQSLAAASEDSLLSVWQGLGYYRRCRLLQAGAKHIVEHGLPLDAEGWRKVPGVGAYTAGAVTSIALGLPEALVDGNVIRVYSRLTADDSVAPTLERNAWAWAKVHVDADRPGAWNQSLMELGATVCKPKQPLCRECPLAQECQALASGRVEDLPRTIPKPPPIQLRHRAVVHRWLSSTGVEFFGLQQIPSGEWWHGMWRFPAEFYSDSNSTYLGTVKHTVTNHRIKLEVSKLECESQVPNLQWFSEDQLEALALPSPQRKALKLIIRREPTLFET